MLKKKELGFDLDTETVRLIDAIITNIAKDDTVKEEFKKLSFIKSLEDNYDDGAGPIEQLLEKVAQIERHKFEESLDLRRVIADLEHLSKVVERYLPSKGKETLKGIHEIDKRSKYYSYKGQ